MGKKDKKDKKIKTVQTTRTEKEVMDHLFGPVELAARRPIDFFLDRRNIWCDQSECRLAMLMCQFKPCGKERAFRRLAIVDRMNRIFVDDPRHAALFLKEEDQARFLELHDAYTAGERVDIRISFEPNYTLRCDLEEMELKIASWFDMKVCEANECAEMPEEDETDWEDDEDEDNGSPVVSPKTNKKRRIPTPEE